MKDGSRWLVVLAALAVVVEITGVAGWWSWQRVVGQLEEAPGRGAAALAGDLTLRLPSAVWRARRLPTRQLGKASDVSAIPALRTLSREQRRWFPADPNGWANRARAEFVDGSLDAALEDLGEAVLRNPTSPGLHDLMALGERARGNNVDALDHLATSEGLATRDGSMGMDLTPEEEAWVKIEGLERRLDHYPRQRSRGAIALAKELRIRDRKELGREYLEAESHDPRVVLELARWDLDDGRTGEAERRLTALSRRSGLPAAISAEIWAITALVRDRVGDVDGAMAAAETAVGYDPRSSAPYRVLAGLAERRGDVDEALRQMRRAWGMNPTDVNLLLAVARIAEKAGENHDARLALERARSVDPSSPALAAVLVEFHLRHGELMDATVTLSDALDRFPTDPRLLRLAEQLRSVVSRH